ncbi:putative LRR receptor-like serine/threonine-protein kinase RLK [Morella rubra]|nr:putative LRR receptor-like serine/threonine-protein kinase RLK [Morella rubra]
MKGTNNSEEEMLKLLKIGMCCCEWNVETRWQLREALEKIEELKERDNDDDYYSTYASEGDLYSSRPMTEEDFSFLG